MLVGEAQINADLCVEVLLGYRGGIGIHPVEDPRSNQKALEQEMKRLKKKPKRMFLMSEWGKHLTFHPPFLGLGDSQAPEQGPSSR